MDVFAVVSEQPMLLVAVLPAAIIAAVRPAWGLCWLLLLVSTHRALYAVGALSTGIKVLLDDGIVVAILLGSLAGAARRRSVTATEGAVPFGALILIILVSAMANGTPLLTVIYGVRFSLLYAVLFFAIQNADIGERAVRGIVNTAIALGVVNAAVAIAQFLGMVPLWALVATTEQHRIGNFYRATGLLGGSGDLGCYLVALNCLASSMATSAGSDRRAWNLHNASAVVMALGIVCTASRGAIVAMILAGLAVVATVRRGRAFIILMALMIGSAVLLIPVISQRFVVIPHEYELGYSLRALYFHTGLDLWKSHAIVGTGMGTFGGAAGTYVSGGLAYELGVYSQIDSFLLALLVQIGVAGLAAFSWMVVRIARRQFRMAERQQGFPRTLAVASLAITCAALPLAVAGTALEQHAFALLFWSVPALASALAASAQRGRTSELKEDAAERLVGPPGEDDHDRLPGKPQAGEGRGTHTDPPDSRAPLPEQPPRGSR